jgi:hypothetical protein
MGRPLPDDESAAPKELVPGAGGLVPKAPPVTDICDPMSPPGANVAVVGKTKAKCDAKNGKFFHAETSSNTRSTWRLIVDAHASDAGSRSPAPIKLNFIRPSRR